MRLPTAALLALVLCGCSVAISGQQATAAGSTAIHTSAATHGQASFGSAKVGASFGKTAPAGAPGGRASLSQGASAALILGLVIADLVHYLSSTEATRPVLLPAQSIADTCSCYGYTPPTEQ